MKAIVRTIGSDGVITARVRRNCRNERVQGRHTDLNPGDRIEVKRQPNNPYLIRTPAKPTAAELEALLDEILDACMALDRWARKTEDVPIQTIASEILELVQQGQGQLP